DAWKRGLVISFAPLRCPEMDEVDSGRATSLTLPLTRHIFSSGAWTLLIFYFIQEKGGWMAAFQPGA
ncbi:MAG: hypothetical protein ACOWYE_08135, partial [Desulfatiglandales bacterium]